MIGLDRCIFSIHVSWIMKIYMKTINLTRSKLNQLYHNMLNRCYNQKFQEEHPYYKGCAVCEAWLDDKYNFYNWVNDGNFYVIDGESTVHLDKDILVKGNKIYSPENCIFAPQSINNLIGGLHSKTDNLPVGVCRTKNGKYKPLIKKFPDVFDTPEEAFWIYKVHKEAEILAKADQYLGQIPMKLYYALLNYKIEITD